MHEKTVSIDISSRRRDPQGTVLLNIGRAWHYANSFLINTRLQLGGWRGQELRNRFNGLFGAKKLLKQLRTKPTARCATSLK